MANDAVRYLNEGAVHAREETDYTTIDSSQMLNQKQRETAQYVSDMALELRNLARSAKLYQVMVPLEYAYYEAYSMANRVHVPQGEIDHIRDLEKASAESEADQEIRQRP